VACSADVWLKRCSVAQLIGASSECWRCGVEQSLTTHRGQHIG
jgi:hypothetical protein